MRHLPKKAGEAFSIWTDKSGVASGAAISRRKFTAVVPLERRPDQLAVVALVALDSTLGSA